MKHDADESSFGICAQNIPSSDATPRGGNHESNTSGEASAPFATLDQTVSALKGDVPGGKLERLGEQSRYLTVVWNASMSESRGEETAERLDVIPAQYRVLVTRRPKYACRA